MSPFAHCPSCRTPSPTFTHGKRLHCEQCGFEFFQNTAAAVGALIRSGEHILFLRRAREPGYGLLDVPGGFVDPGETLEEALRRECLEEIGEEPVHLTYFCSLSNTYLYAGVEYTTADAFFFAELDRPIDNDDLLRLKIDRSEVLSLHLLHIAEIRSEDLAFPSLQRLQEKLMIGSLSA